jgi:polyisoprenoid-binding protein YceI
LRLASFRQEEKIMRARIQVLIAATAVAAVAIPASAQRGEAQPNTDTTTGLRLEVMEGSRATYRVREQLAGINFPSDAAGSTSDVTGQIVVRPDGSIDAAQSKLTVDLRTLRGDQDQRDNYVRGNRLLDSEQFPFAEFVPRRAVNLPWPFPSQNPAQAGFQLVGDLTIKGTTQETTWNVVSTFNPMQVSSRAMTDFTFERFALPKPTLARLLSVDENIHLELEIRFRRVTP